LRVCHENAALNIERRQRLLVIGLILTESSLQIYTSKYVMLSAVICRQNMADYIIINPHIDVKDSFLAIIKNAISLKSVER